jgi:hypothetical protein
MNENRANTTPKIPLYLTASVFFLVVLLAPYSSLDDLSLTGILSLAVSGAASAWLFANVKWPVGAATAIPILLISYFLSDSSLLLLCKSLLYLVFGITFALVYRNRMTRASAVGISGIIITVTVLVMLLGPILMEQGTLSVEAIHTHYANYFEQLTEMLKKSFTITIAGSEVSYVTDTNVHQYLNMLIALTPGIIGFLSVLTGFLCGGVFKILIRLSHLDPPGDDAWKLKPAFATGVFFCLALFLCLIRSESNYSWLVAINFILFLAPEFCMAGLFSVFEIRYVHGLPRPRILRGILLFIGMLNGIEGLLLVTIMFGIVDSIRSALPAKKEQNES